MKHFTRVILMAALAAVIITSPLLAQEQKERQLRVPLTNPDKPVMLEASLMNGSILVEGYDGREIVIDIIGREQPDPKTRVNGMRVIPNSSMGLAVEEMDNHVEISSSFGSKIEMLKVSVPRRTSMGLSTIQGGEIRVEGVEGELELNNTNGPITALGISGSVVAHTTNGSVKVTFDRIHDGKSMSFVSFNGDIDVTFPPGLKADLRLSSNQGDIYTDFEYQPVPQEPVVHGDRKGKSYRVEIDREVRADIGGGGPEMHFKTWRGNIYIRKQDSR